MTADAVLVAGTFRWWAPPVVVILLLANALFVAVEFALVAARPSRLEGESGILAEWSRRAMGDINRQLAGAQLGITVASLGLGAVAEPAVAALVEPLLIGIVGERAIIHGVSVAIALALVTAVHMVLGEMVPKNLAIAGPEPTLKAVIVPFEIWVVVAMPVLWALTSVGDLISRAVGVEPRHEVATARTAEDIAAIVEELVERPDSPDVGEGLRHLVTDAERRLLGRVADFSRATVDAVMIPRTQIRWLDGSLTVAEAEAEAHASGRSRLPVAANGLNGATTFVHVKDLITQPLDLRGRSVSDVRSSPIVALAADTSLEDALERMRNQSRHLALVRDPAARVIGLVTLEDLVEELVGEIEDEHDGVRRPSSGLVAGAQRRARSR